MIYSITVKTETGRKFLLTEAESLEKALANAVGEGNILEVQTTPYDKIV